MAVIKTTNPSGDKTICFKYPVAKLFEDVSLDTLTMADKMPVAQGEINGDRIDEYGLTDDERYQFENFLMEGHSKVFAKLLKMTSGVADSIVLNLLPMVAVPPVAKRVTLDLSGIAGSGTIDCTPVGPLVINYMTSLLTTVAFWAVNNAPAYQEQGILLGYGTHTITFTAEVPGVDFPTPTFTPGGANLTGEITVDAQNVEGQTEDPFVSVTIRDKEGYNENYLDIINNEIYLAIKHYILKEWYVKCLLGDPSKYYEMKYVENLKAIQKYGLMLRKPMRQWNAPATV